jgi:hypothetical protein
MKQTAVEWFLTEFQKQVWFEHNSELDIWIKDLIQQAKEMEKEQIIEAFKEGFTEGCRYTTGFEQTLWEYEEDYYNETYKK